MQNRLYRSRRDRLIGGVCGGLGAYFGIDPVIVRIVFVALAIWGGAGLLLYLILWVIMPPEERTGATSEEVMHSNVDEIRQEVYGMGQEVRGAVSGESQVPRERTIWLAVGLIVLGVIALAGALFGIAFANLWPLILIVFGGYLIYQAIRR